MDADSETTEKRHPIQVVARRTGLTADVLRAWEKRYGVVEPGRSEGGRRLYSDRDVERLRLLVRVTDAGRRIGSVAELDTAELRALVREDVREEARAAPASSTAGGNGAPERYLQACWEAVESFDARALESALVRAVLSLSAPVLLDRVAAPLLHGIGDRWRDGSLGAGSEHMATAVVRGVLESLIGSFTPPAGAPHIVVATPVGQAHELGALFVAAVAATEGWRVTYLGTDLPAGEIGAVVRGTGARAVALSLVFPEGDEAVARELQALRAVVGENVELVAGGGALASYASALDLAGIAPLDNLDVLRTWLAERAS